ncbi:hypothetical protein SAMN05443575_1917 [Jatrophihabitans endophyticus]|uniref:Beta-galactosidase n=1 Tax=Jatrophihabitans endophyticus TaxID=1206085 RepID=A0A1M5IJI7_9ACTN|nr:hypothetical protein [Jatrophihabitans endophyticus]SHG28524.1 hypothetical protein SAMN05443575_1917 [Jatrophihabitans endophyticus]
MRNRPGAIVATLVLLAVTAIAAGAIASPRPAAAAAGSAPFVATLATHVDTADQESAAGLKVGMLEVHWNRFEPQRGVVDTDYATGIKAQFDKLRKAGMQVTLGLGLHFTPSWILSYKSNHLVDNHGTYSTQADFVFNRAVRARGNWYLAQLDRWLGLENMWAVRVTSGGSSELLYPSSTFWAYSPGAQTATNRPKTLAANPMPGWRPGDRSTRDQRNAWAHWYVGALADVADWQMATVTNLGFRGYFQPVTPGQGIRPGQWNAQMAAGLAEGTLGRGAAWYVLYASLRERTHVTAYLSSLADGTADDDLCTAADAAKPLQGTDFSRWSGARWLAWVAHYNHFTIAGEPPGRPATAGAALTHYRDGSAAGLLATAMRQATSCGFLGVYWAHDDQVWDGTMPLRTLAAYTSPSATAPAAA